MPEQFKALLTQYYQSPQVDELVAVYSNSTLLLIEYLYYLTKQFPNATNTKPKLYADCKTAARLLSQISVYWMEPEWNAMLTQLVDSLEQITGAVMSNSFKKLEMHYSLHRRLTEDMSGYFSGGIISDKSFSRLVPGRNT